MEYLVIGAGPAGLRLGHFPERAGCDCLILEAGNGIMPRTLAAARAFEKARA